MNKHIKTRNDWLIVLLNDDSSRDIIDKALSEAVQRKELKLNGWRYDTEKRMLIFDGYPEQTITKISLIISGCQALGLIQIDKTGMF